MDILTEVVDALQLTATTVQRVNDVVEHREELQAGEAAIVIIGDGRCTVRTAIGDLQLVSNDYVLLVGKQVAEFSGVGQPLRQLLRCRYSLLTELPHPFARQLPLVASLSSRYLTDHAEVGRAVAMLDSELANTRLGSVFVTARLAEIVFVEALRKCQLEEQTAPAFLSALADAPVSRSLELIHGSPNRAWRVDELAAGAGLSRAAFTERFHKRVGDPPLRYLRAWRLLDARRELVRTVTPIREVAARAGYRSANGFSRAFRRFFGTAPSTLRRLR